MKLPRFLIAAALAAVTVQASDFVGIYGLITKVVFEPDADHPQRVQVFGVFSIAGNSNGSEYLPAQRGYLYFTLPAGSAQMQENAFHEWMDLQSSAGTNTVVGFSARLVGPAPPPRVRKTDEKPSMPDAYRLGTGTVKMKSDSNHPAVRSLLELR
jgi:hypothetical protein